MGIWPTSPYFPQLTFTFGLMDWLEALMMECQVALKDFCAALQVSFRGKKGDIPL